MVLSRPFIEIKLLLSRLLISPNFNASIIEFLPPGAAFVPVS